MKVIIIGPAHPLRGGIADFNEALCKAFIDAGDSCSIYSFSYQYPSFLFPGTSQFSGDAAPSNLEIHPAIHSLNPLSWYQTAKRIIAAKPDAVLVRFWLPFMAPSTGSICRMIRRKGIKVIAITDNVIPHEKRPGDHILTRYFLRSCDAFIAMSASVEKDIHSFISAAKTAFLPHPVYNIFGDGISKEIARKKLGIPQDRKLALFFGFIRAYKGLDLLLDAMADERLKKMNLHLLVAGEFYEDRNPYFDQVEKNQIQDLVVFHSSFIPKEDVRYYFCAADIIVQPYRNATQSGITQIAYHFERPMIVTNVGGLPEIVTDQVTGYVTETNAASIADALFDFYKSNREGEISDKVRKGKQRFTWNAFIEGFKKIYAQL